MTDARRWLFSSLLGFVATVAVAGLARPAAADLAKDKDAHAGKEPKDATGSKDDKDDAFAVSERFCLLRALAPIRAHFVGAEGDAWDLKARASDSDLDAIWKSIGNAIDARVAVDAIVALVPDPVDSGYVYQFESLFRAVLSGVERDGFLRDEGWTPWNDSHVDEEKTRTAIETCRLWVPAVRVFRTGADARTAGARVALFVGESPTAGIHKAAFARAVEFAERLRTTGHTLKVIGPSFSGSASSLRDALELALVGKVSETNQVDIVSGSATNRGVAEMLSSLTVHAADRSIPVTYRLTTRDDTIVDRKFLAWLLKREGLRMKPDHDRRIDGVALLVESGTAYGAQSTAIDVDGGLHPEVVLRFRRGIRDLERAYAEMDQRAKANSTDSRSLAMRPTMLESSFDERQKPRDGDAQRSPKTIEAEDLDLANLLAEISREGIRYVAIRATDPADAVFLGRKIRDVAPDVRLVFLASDVLLLHPDSLRDLHGSFVVSPYPFFGTGAISTEQVASKPRAYAHEHMPWESQAAEGTFNATVALLAEHAQASDGDADGIMARLTEYAPHVARSGSSEGCGAREPLLPLWIAVIGQGGNNGAMYPIDVLDVAPAEDRHLLTPCPKDAAATIDAGSWTIHIDEDITPPRGWTFALAIALIIGIGEALRFRASSGMWIVRAEQAPPSMATSVRAGPVTPLSTRAASADENPRETDPPGSNVVPQLDGARRRQYYLGGTRAKYLAYAALRATVIAAVVVYMLVVHWLALLSLDSTAGDAQWVVTCALTVLGSVPVFAAATRVRGAAAAYWTSFMTGTKKRWESGCGLTFLGALVVFLAFSHGLRDFTDAAFVHWVAARLRAHPMGVVLLVALGSTALFVVVKRASAGVRKRENGDAHHPNTGSDSSGSPPSPKIRALADFVAGKMPSHATFWYRVHVIYVLSAMAVSVGFVSLMRGYDAYHAYFGGLAIFDGTKPPGAGVAFALRSLPLSSGVSSALVVVVTGTAIAMWIHARMHGLALSHAISLMTPGDACKDWVTTPLSHVTGIADVHMLERRLQHVIHRPAAFRGSFLTSIVIFGVPLIAFLIKGWSTLDGFEDGRSLIFVIAIGASLVAMTTQHLLEFWVAFNAIVKRLRFWGPSSYFSHAAGVVGVPVSVLVTRHVDSHAELASCVTLLEQLVVESAALGKETRARAIFDECTKMLAARAAHATTEQAHGGDLGPLLVVAACHLRLWLATELPDPFASAQDSPPNAEPATQSARTRLAAERFVGAVMAVIMNRYARHLRHYMTGLAIPGALLVVAVSAYPFQPHRLFLSTAWVLVLSVIGSGLYVYFGMERDTVMSRIAGTKPTEIPFNREIVVRFFTWVAVPLVTLLAAQYPQVSRVVSGVLDPLSRAFR